MTIEELRPHLETIKRQTIGFYKAPSGVFEGESKMARWRNCFRLVAESWLIFGPQKDGAADPESVILLPDRIVDIYALEEILKFGKQAKTIVDVWETERRHAVFAQREVERLSSLLNTHYPTGRVSENAKT